MSLERLASLAEVARHGAITEAARALGLTQPALSRRIQALERDLGAPLLERSRKGVALTELGRLAVEEGRSLLERWERLRATVRAHLRLERGTVRIGGGAAAVSFLLPEVIRDFRREHSGILFQLREAGSRDVEQAVLEESLELGIVTMPVRNRELLATPLLKDPIVLIAAQGHPIARAGKVPAAALDGAPIIGFEAGSAIRALIDRALERRGVHVDVVMELRSIQSIVRMVAIGQGLAFVSRLGVESGPEEVAVVDVAGLRIVRSLAVIRHRTRPLSPAAEAFLHHLRGIRR